MNKKKEEKNELRKSHNKKQKILKTTINIGAKKMIRFLFFCIENRI